MSSAPVSYNFPAQLADMAGIPATQAQAGLIQAQTAQMQQQTNYQAWLNSLVRNMQNTPATTTTAGMVEPTLVAPDASAPASAGTPSSVSPLTSNVPYVAGNAGATPSAPAPSVNRLTGGVSASNSASVPVGNAPSAASASTTTPASIDTGANLSGADALDQHELATNGRFDKQKLFNDVWAHYQLPAPDPNMASMPGPAGEMYRQRYDSVVKATQLKAYQDIEKMSSVASAKPGTVFRAYDQVYGTTANPNPSATLEAHGITEDQLKNEMWVSANIVNHAAQLPLDTQDNGATITYINPHNKQPMFGLGTVTKQNTPEAVLKAATEQRGQDVTAATAARGQNIGALDVQKDANGNPFIVNRRTGALFSVGGAAPGGPIPNRLIAGDAGGSPAATPLPNALVGPRGMPSVPASAASGVAPTAPPTSTSAVPVVQPKLLPGVNIAALPQTDAAPTGFQNNSQALDVKAASDRKNATIASSIADVSKSANDNALMTQLQNHLNSIDPNSRIVGPGSAAYKTGLELEAAVTGKSPDALNVMGITAKLAAQLGMQNAQQLLKGMRITQNELQYVTTVASANPNQPLAVMKAIVALGKANSEYTGLAGQTAIRAIKSGADPDQLAGGIEAQSPRSQYVGNRVTEMVSPAPARSLAALKQYPSKALDFKAKYGYLPTGQQ